jgi:hypothetical protein
VARELFLVMSLVFEAGAVTGAEIEGALVTAEGVCEGVGISGNTHTN